VSCLKRFVIGKVALMPPFVIAPRKNSEGQPKPPHSMRSVSFQMGFLTLRLSLLPFA
jgi:hypothetical protein